MWQSIREFVLRLAGIYKGSRRERELFEELEFHLALKQAHHQKHGATYSESASEAHRDFGGLERWKERCRDAGTISPLEDLQRDVHLAVRMLRKSPVFTCVAVTTLAAAIGANTTIFSLIDAILLKAIEVPHADRLALLRIRPGDYGYSFSYPWFKRIQKESSGIMRVFAFTTNNLRLKTSGGAEELPAQLVSGSYFPTLGIAPVLGRYITPQEDRPGTPDGQIAVISGAFWRSKFGSDRSILGRKLTINRTVFTIVGVMPEEFRGMDRDQRPKVFLPLETEP